MPALTILLVTMNRRDFLERALYYIYETSTDAERNIWIWDNASTDDTSDFLGTMVGWPGVRAFRSQTNVGLAEAHRRMLLGVNTPYVFTLDDDVWLINRGWVSACVRVLAADESLHQLMIPQAYVHKTSDFGIVHEQLTEPFLRVPPMQPQDRIPFDTAAALKNHGAGGVSPSAEREVVDIADEKVVVPVRGTQLPFAVSGCSSAWRVSDLLPLVGREDRHGVVDLREAWGFVLQRERGLREGVILGYGMFHACPGPLWHLGRNERYWQTKCDIAPEIYGRSSEEQAQWLENARRASGWGQPLEDPMLLGELV